MKWLPAAAAVGLAALVYIYMKPRAPVEPIPAPAHAPAGDSAPASDPPPDAGPDPEPGGVEDDPEGEALSPLAAFHRETDPHALMELAADLRDHPRMRANPDVVATMLAVARETTDPARAEAARMFLLGCEDLAGDVTAFFIASLGALDPSELPLFIDLNPAWAPDLHRALLDRARAVPEERAALVAATRGAGAREFSEDENPEVRAAVYGVLGHRRDEAAWLESRWEGEGDDAAREALMMALARAGAADALDRTGDPEARVWAQIVREYPHHTMDFLIEERARRP